MGSLHGHEYLPVFVQWKYGTYVYTREKAPTLATRAIIRQWLRRLQGTRIGPRTIVGYILDIGRDRSNPPILVFM